MAREHPAGAEDDEQGGGEPDAQAHLGGDAAGLGAPGAGLPFDPDVGTAVRLGRHGRRGRQFIGMGTVEPVLEHPAAVGGQPGTPPDLEQSDLLVTDLPLRLQCRTSGPGHRQVRQVPAPRPDHGPRPGAVAGQLRHQQLAHRQEEDLGYHAEQLTPGVAAEHGQQLVAALQFLERDRAPMIVGFRGRPLP